MSEAPISHRRDPHSSKNHKNLEKSRLKRIFMLRDCVNERLTLEIVLRYRSCKLIKISTFGCKVPCGVFSLKRQLSWIKTPRIYGLFGGRLGLLQFRDCKGWSSWRRLWAWILWGNVLRSVTRKTMAVLSD